MTAEPHAVVAHLGEDFLAEASGRTYRLMPGGQAVAGLLDWDDVNEILARHRLEAPRLRLSVNGVAVPSDAYTVREVARRRTVWNRLHPAALHEQLAKGATLVIDSFDELHPGVQSLAGSLETALRSRVQVNLYASWTATEGFGVHWDDHDVVVVQVDGRKRWRIYGPTRVAPTYRDVAEAEMPPEEPIAEFVLVPGDVLYLPRGWWHAVSASEGERSLHLTCGLTTTTGRDLVSWVLDSLLSEELVRADLPHFGSAAEKQRAVNGLRELIVKELADGSLIDRYFEHQDADERVRLRPSLPFVAGVPADPDLRARLLATRHTLGTDEDGNAVLAAGGESWTFAPPALPLLERLTDRSEHRLADLVSSTGLTLEQAAAVVGELVAGQIVAVGGAV
ncbi:JmjC domain-containing protein [Streptomyces sp. NPDC059477]|uniref:JmjC domain-containing protein n=1 Tax=Streptomyces sp. NPDC059477 TaxID=3346847 RepID=UPI0036C33224